MSCALSLCVYTVLLLYHIHQPTPDPPPPPPHPSLLMLSKFHCFHLGLCSTKISAPFQRDLQREDANISHCGWRGGLGWEEMRKERISISSLNVTLGLCSFCFCGPNCFWQEEETKPEDTTASQWEQLLFFLRLPLFSIFLPFPGVSKALLWLLKLLWYRHWIASYN